MNATARRCKQILSTIWREPRSDGHVGASLRRVSKRRGACHGGRRRRALDTQRRGPAGSRRRRAWHGTESFADTITDRTGGGDPRQHTKWMNGRRRRRSMLVSACHDVVTSMPPRKRCTSRSEPRRTTSSTDGRGVSPATARRLPQASTLRREGVHKTGICKRKEVGWNHASARGHVYLQPGHAQGNEGAS